MTTHIDYQGRIIDDDPTPTSELLVLSSPDQFGKNKKWLHQPGVAGPMPQGMEPTDDGADRGDGTQGDTTA